MGFSCQVPPAGCVIGGPSTPGPAARILPDGLAAVPQDAPAQVQAAIAAGNRIIDTSYSIERQPNMLSTVMGSYVRRLLLGGSESRHKSNRHRHADEPIRRKHTSATPGGRRLPRV